jgi:hypothetical protein
LKDDPIAAKAITAKLIAGMNIETEYGRFNELKEGTLTGECLINIHNDIWERIVLVSESKSKHIQISRKLNHHRIPLQVITSILLLYNYYLY